VILTAWLRDGLVSVFRSISLQSISYNNLHARPIVVSSPRFSYIVVLALVLIEMLRRLHIRVPIYLWISAPQTMGQYPVSEFHLLLNFATLYLMLDCSLTFRHHSHISAITHMILNMFTTERKMRYFPGFNGEEILPQPPKEKLNGCSRRFCLRRVSPQEISPRENLERFNTLCEKQKQQVHLAASKVVNDWHTPDKPAGLTPTRDRKVKPAPRVTARATCPASKPKSYRELIEDAGHTRWLRRQGFEALEALERARRERERRAARGSKYGRFDPQWNTSVYHQHFDVFNPK
jgi:hypothetical protein